MYEFAYRLLESTVLLYAGLKSFKAIKSKDPSDDTQWLTFWLLYTLFDFITTVADIAIGWILPFYREIKLVFLVYIGLGGGATALYPLVEPFLAQGVDYAEKYKVEDYVNQAKATVQSFADKKQG